ncbi:MAG: M28 family metallopeptidase [Sandaracinaceae bacterium]
MRELVEALCSDECAGRAPGTPGGVLARRYVIDALRAAGLDPHEQAVPKANGANVIATLAPKDIDRYVMVAAHYDHLGKSGKHIFRGADDNAAAVAILVEVARGLAKERPDGRGVIIAAFDAEEPPHFMSGSMGSEHFARHPTVALDKIDLMVCMDLVGHSFGGPMVPSEVRETVFALGAERSRGTLEMVDAIGDAEAGVRVRTADAEIIPPLSDYAAFWDRHRPFMLLTNGRSRVYHTPEDVPELLAYDKMAATARWLERLTRQQCARDEEPFAFSGSRNDRCTLTSLEGVLAPLEPFDSRAAFALERARELRGKLDAKGRLPSALSGELSMLVAGLENALA